MNLDKVPMGFGMALSMNPTALHAYGTMTEEERQKILKEAQNAKSREEMHSLVVNLARGTGDRL